MQPWIDLTINSIDFLSMSIRPQQLIGMLKRELYVAAKVLLVTFCAFVIGGLITISLFMLLHAGGWLGRENGAWALTAENEEFAFKMTFVLAMFLGGELIVYLLKVLGKSSKAATPPQSRTS
jgi:hypothetical protein